MLIRLLLLLLFFQYLAIAQDEVAISFPSHGSSGISPSSPVIFRSLMPIDSAAILRDPHALMVVRDSIARRFPKSDWFRYRIHGSIVGHADSVYAFIPSRLLPSTTYRISAGGSEYVFTTSGNVPSVSYCSLATSDVITCADTIRVGFNAYLPTGVAVDSVVIIEQQQQDGVWGYVPCSVTINGLDCIVIPKGGWTAGNQLRVRIRCSWYAGDTYLDRVYESMVRGASRLTCDVRVPLGNNHNMDLLEKVGANGRVVVVGDSFTIDAPKFVAPNLQFSHWESTYLKQINGDSSAHVTQVLACEQARRELRVTAVYTESEDVTIRLEIDSSGLVDVFRQSGQHLGSFRDTTTLVMRVDEGPLLLTAKTTLRSYPISVRVNGKVYQTGAIVIPTKLATRAPSICINPKFEILEPTNDTLYRLRGSIADLHPDELHDVYSAVRFTTPYQYESANSGVRTICVEADACWEIVGYHDQSVGSPIWFDDGVSRYCLTAEMLDPENHVVFYARRKSVDLRLELALLGSEDPRSQLFTKTVHPETRIDVQREELAGGQKIWVSLLSSQCVDAGLRIMRYGLRCGDNVRFVVYPATHRGQQWRWWSAINGYTQPTLQRPGPSPIYTMVVDPSVATHNAKDCEGQDLSHREIRIQGAFRQKMIVESIGLRVRVNALVDRWNARFEERWFDPLTYYDKDVDEPVDGRQLEYIPRMGTPVRARFSLPLDVETIHNKTIKAESFDNVLLTDPHANDLDFIIYSDTTGNTNVLSSTGQFLDIIEIMVCDPTTKPRLQALHTGSIDVTYSQRLRSYFGDVLEAPVTLALRRMELPGYGVKLRSINVHDDGDWDLWPFVNRGELYQAVYGGDMTSRRALQTDKAFVRLPDCSEQQGIIGECTTLHGDTDGPLSFGERPLWMQTAWMDASDIAWVQISTWDEDCKDENDCLTNRLGDVIDSLRVRVSKYNVPIEAAALDWKALIPDIVKTGVDLIDALVVPDDQDDFLAESSIIEDSQTLWGMRSAEAPFITRSHENADYVFRGQWYTTRAVVR